MHLINGLRSATLLLFAIMLAACQTLPVMGKLPDNLALEKIAAVDENSPFAVAPDGNVVALVSSGLQLLHIPTREQLPVSAKSPRKLAWSPLGYTLAALFSEGQKSRVTTYDQYGTVIAETVIDIPLTDIGWLSEDELALGGAVIKEYKFGTNYLTVLCRWKFGQDNPVVSELRDTTLQPATIHKWKAFLERGPLMDFSSQTPLISYVQPVDPPVFTPYYKLTIKDLASGKEMDIAGLNLNADGARLSADGEKILFGDGKGTTIVKNPWTEEVLSNVSTLGSSPALAPDAESWFTDNRLFRHGITIATLTPGTVAQFTADSSRLVLENDGNLYLLSGLQPAAGTLFVPALNDKIQKLRSLKAEGLITPAEYKTSLERIAQP